MPYGAQVRPSRGTPTHDAEQGEDQVRSSYRHVVIGAGVIGSPAAFCLSQRSEGDVLLLEQYRLGHDRGSSNDHSRIIRHA